MRAPWIAVAFLVLAACSGSDDGASDTTPETQAPLETEAPATDPPATDPPATDPPVTEPIATDPTATDPVDTEPVTTEPTATDAADGEGEGDDEELTIDGPARVRPSCDSLPRGVTSTTLEAGGGVHDVRIYVPEMLSSDPAPTVLNWHGLGSNGPEQAAFSGYETLAETEEFVVVHPTGLDVGDGRNSWELAQFDTPARDDLAFADALIDLLVQDWCADESRIYSTGMSNGGFFTSELVCHRSTRIAAAASVAGMSNAPGCDPERAVPYISFHGTDDNVVPFAGGGESTLSDATGP